MNSNELLEFLLTRVQLCRDFPKDKLEELIARSKTGTFEQHEAVIKFGEENRYFHILIEGSAEAAVTNDRGEKLQLSLFSPGDFFGEISLMTGERTIVDIIGLTHCTSLFIPADVFTSIITSHAPALKLLSRSLNKKIVNWSNVIPRDNLTRAEERHNADPYGFKLKSDTPIKILVFNCGSSSLKYSLFNTAGDLVAAKGLIENIGLPNGKHKYAISGTKKEHPLAANDFNEAIADMIAVLTSPEHKCFSSPDEVCCIGHRVVHGGRYTDSIVVTDEVIAGIEEASHFAPLHNPAHLQGIRAAMKIFPKAHHVTVFDTAFHHTLPNYAFTYGLPYELYEKKQIRRYGFHGTSHHYVSLRAAQFMKYPYNSLNLISCHLGNGSSMCAIDHGRSVDTTMGLTPTAGLIMGTRCGDIDPGILYHLQKYEGYSIEDCNRLTTRQSGFLGISGVSSDLREITAAANDGNERAQLTIKCFAYQIRKNIGAYIAVMKGLDAIIFTGGIGEGSAMIRNLSCQGLECIGIRIDEARNNSVDPSQGACDIAADDSHVKILVIPTDEERMIARETLRAIKKEQTSGVAIDVKKSILIEVSAHHVHLSNDHIETLFGKGHTLTPMSDLSQPGQFSCEEKVTLVGPKGTIERVRILGPARKETQIEISMTEKFKLGIQPPVRESGDIANTPGLTLKGPAGEVLLEKGVICAKRHIHASPAEALLYGIHDKETRCVRVESDRGLIFDNVAVRVHPSFKLAMHIDTDEANAAGISGEATGIIL